MTENKKFWGWMYKNKYAEDMAGFYLVAGMTLVRERDVSPQMILGYYQEYLAGYGIYMIIYVDETIERYAKRLGEEIEKL